MPTRQQAAFIDESVASVFGDRVPCALLVQDGASTDDTAERLAALGRQHPGLSVDSRPDSGPAEGLDRALRRALDTGAPVIGWLNSDDLYAPGALRRALAHLEAHPEHVAVYGQADHIDVDGRHLGPYPTRTPELPLSDWRDGCPVCQPTMFLRRETVQALLPVDTSLRTAFDFELWLRLFKAYPGRIGFVPTLQARSRLHDASITLRQREQVAMEAMAVVHRHLGAAPGHWLVTHAAEALALCPVERDTQAVKQHLLALAEQASPWLAPGGVGALQRELQASRAWQLTGSYVGAKVHADGWAGPTMALRLRQPLPPTPVIGSLRVVGRHAWPRPGALRQCVTAWHGGQRVGEARAWWRQRFVLDIPVASRQPGQTQEFELQAAASFVPAEVLARSHDMRRLAWQVETIDLVPLQAGVVA